MKKSGFPMIVYAAIWRWKTVKASLFAAGIEGTVVGPLADPPRYGGEAADAFHVVCPSLPGYGFSDKPGGPGWGVERIADAWATLMARLGYTRYGAQGSDWGSSISSCLAQQHAEHVVGIQLTPPLG
jgi:pimeloyl-ACP methyl ester carboxylesterase